MKDYLVTGGLGFIGSHLVEALLKEDPDNRVWIIDDGVNASWNPRKGRLDYEEQARDLLVQIMGGYDVDNDTRNPRLVCISGDCAHRNVLDRIRAGHFRAVFHLAANVSVAKSIEEPMVTLEQNTLKSLKIAKACAQGHTRLVFSSSASVYSHLDAAIPIQEGSAMFPTNPYGLSKMTCENWFKAYEDLYGLDYVVLRYFNVYGPRQLGGSPYAGVIGNWVQALWYKKPLVIYGSGNQTRDFVYVGDVVLANIAALKEEIKFRTFNVCAEKCHSLNDIIKVLREDSYGTFKVKYEESRQEVKHSIGSNARATIALEWKPSVTFREGLNKTLRWRGL
jgi:UDP-glucose 4-epimerase